MIKMQKGMGDRSRQKRLLVSTKSRKANPKPQTYVVISIKKESLKSCAPFPPHLLIRPLSGLVPPIRRKSNASKHKIKSYIRIGLL
jgi:hypothetical protein